MGVIKNFSDIGNSVASVVSSGANVLTTFAQSAEYLGQNASEYSAQNLVLSRMERVAEFKDTAKSLEVSKEDREEYKAALNEWL